MSPAALLRELGPLVPEIEATAAPAPPPVTVKSSGMTGEQLEGDVYFFKLHGLRRCAESEAGDAKAQAGGAPGASARVIVGAEVEIKSKHRLAVSPRDVIVNQGGVMFYANVKPKQQLKDCTPLLQIARLREKEVAKGYVIFELPASVTKDLELSYQPTRFGGSGQVRVRLEGF